MFRDKISVYRTDKVNSGSSIQFERNAYGNCGLMQDEIDKALDCDIEVEKQKLEEIEKAIFNDIQEKLKEWESVAREIIPLKMAEEYLKDCKLIEDKETTNNEWVVERNGEKETHTISNKSYLMYISVFELSREWHVSYSLFTNGKIRHEIKSVNFKNFKDDKEKAYKYMEGRKKYFSKYFQELYQPIMKEYVSCYTSQGRLIKGYRVEE